MLLSGLGLPRAGAGLGQKGLPDRMSRKHDSQIESKLPMADVPPQVSLVGAGPGHPGLLTLRAVECLSQADLVIYDQLVPDRLLEHAPASAERLCLSTMPGCRR